MATVTSGSIVLRSQDAITANEPPSTSELVGLDSATLTETWHVKFPARQCGFAALPVATNGAIVCYGKDMVVFRPSSDIATPVATPSRDAGGERKPANHARRHCGAGLELSGIDSWARGGAATTLLWEDSLDPNAPMNASILAHIFGEVAIQIDSYGLHEILLARSLQTGEDPAGPSRISSASSDTRSPVRGSWSVSRKIRIASALHERMRLRCSTCTPANSSGKRNTSMSTAQGRCCGPGGWSVGQLDLTCAADPMTVVAVGDSAPAMERWRFDAAQGRTEAEMVGECTARQPSVATGSSTECNWRSAEMQSTCMPQPRPK